jgi:acyl dehydratase
MRIGDRAEVERTYRTSDAAELAELAGLEAGGMEHVPEPLVAALFSYLLGVRLPGPGTNYLKQEMTFLAEARWGEALTASVEVTRLRPDKGLVDLATLCVQGGAIVCRGRALVLFKADKRRAD